MTDEWEKLEGEKNFWSPTKIGDTLEGQLVEVTQGMYGSKFTIKTEKGNIITQSHKVLQSRLAGAKVGEQVKIVYTGTVPPAVRGQNPTFLYDVFHKPKEEIVK